MQLLNILLVIMSGIIYIDINIREENETIKVPFYVRQKSKQQFCFHILYHDVALSYLGQFSYQAMVYLEVEG